MRPQTVKWLARPSVALAQALAVVGPFPAFGQATSGLACGWPQSPTLWWDRLIQDTAWKGGSPLWVTYTQQLQPTPFKLGGGGGGTEVLHGWLHPRLVATG